MRVLNQYSKFLLRFTTSRFIDIIILRRKKYGIVRHAQVFLTFPQIETKESEQKYSSTQNLR